MKKVKIFGAGSIGNHLANASRKLGWDVLICDLDAEALERTKNDIYPARYGAWDPEIRLAVNGEVENEQADIVIIGTPPEYHIDIAIDAIQKSNPKGILVEKPFCTPSMERCDELVALAEEKGIFVGVGYNHVLAANTKSVEEMLKSSAIGKIENIGVRWLEYWGGIFKAHPWLDGPHDSYLGFYERGGGACGEHSHGINIWQHFANVLGKGKVTEVTAMTDIVDDGKVKYDRIAQIGLRTETGFTGWVIQDVITEPSVKTVRIQGENGAIEWFANYIPDNDAVVHHTKEGTTESLIPKTRPDDFKGEIEHLGEILDGKVDPTQSPISMKRGLETMLVVAAAYKSGMEKKAVTINYDAGFSPNALS